jgi:acetyltransferase-like isoleucine patch superfamily enzyme
MVRWTLVRRVLTPMPLVQFYYFWKYGARISRRAEVDLTSDAVWGPGCVIAPYSKVKIPGPFAMGRGVRIGTGCFIDSGWAGLTIGDGVEVGPNCSIISVSYRFDRLDQPLPDQGLVSHGIRIGQGVRLGPGCVVLDGAEIPADECIPAGTVVRGRFVPGRGKRLTPSRMVLPES